MTSCLEDELVALFASVGPPPAGVALACVGSMARRELGPRSDVDLVLLHDGSSARGTAGRGSAGRGSAGRGSAGRARAGDGTVMELDDRLWYPIWDSGVRMDHSVRTPEECAEVSTKEISAATGLLDLRLVAGDADLVATTRGRVLEAWRSGARRRLPELLATFEERHAASGDGAYLLEPDLKEARGGFRDMSMLGALAATWLTDRPHSGLREPYERLLDVRDALHVVAGRPVDRLLAGEADEVGRLLGYADTDRLRREVSMACRQIGHALDITAREARRSAPPRRVLGLGRRGRRPDFVQAPHGLIIHQGEVGLDRTTSAADPLVGLRAGALAARRALVLSPVTAQNLGEQMAELPTPWPEEAREAFLDLLSAGPALLPVWESLDLAGCIERWIPSWRLIVAQPQHNPIHRHTVERHSVQTAVEAHPFLTRVERPDLLLLACLFHDIGKPAGGADHAAVGAPVAREAVRAMGVADEDADLVARLVRHHLTLAELATRRDHTDPATMSTLISAVGGRAEVLNLLRRLTEADARAAGPTAWSPWRAQLITSLADRAEARLAGEERTDPAPAIADVGLARSVRVDGRPRVTMEVRPGGVQLVIAAPDRLGLFSDTAGLLVEHGISVRSAMLATVGEVAVNTWRVDKESVADLPDPAYLVKQLERLQAGDRTVLDRVQRRESRLSRTQAAVEPYVAMVTEASDTAAVVEVRASDRAGLLYALGAALAGAALSIRSAHISTLAGQAIDTFYVTEPDGSRPDEERARVVLATLRRAAAPALAGTADVL